MPSAAPEYEDEHRLFVQGIMAKGVLNNKEVHALHEKVLKICNIEIPEKKKDLIDLLAKNIRTINNEIESVGLMIKKGVEEDTGESCFMLVNTQSRAVGGNKFLATKVQSQFSPAELDYLRLLATEILQSGEKMITSRMALNLMDQVGGGKKLSMSEAEASIEKFISCRWLKLVEEGCLTVDVRFLGEMETWMVEVVGGVAKCQICRKVVVRGVYCTCDPMVAWHKHCLAKQVKANVETICKNCKSPVHLDRERAGTQQLSRKRKDMSRDGEGERDAPDIENGIEGNGQDKEDKEATEEGSRKEVEKSKKRERRRANVESDSE